MSMQSLEFYTDYRQYLRVFYDHKKRASRHYSYRQFCNRAGLKSPSIYREVTDGLYFSGNWTGVKAVIFLGRLTLP